MDAGIGFRLVIQLDLVRRALIGRRPCANRSVGNETHGQVLGRVRPFRDEAKMRFLFHCDQGKNSDPVLLIGTRDLYSPGYQRLLPWLGLPAAANCSKLLRRRLRQAPSTPSQLNFRVAEVARLWRFPMIGRTLASSATVSTRKLRRDRLLIVTPTLNSRRPVRKSYPHNRGCPQLQHSARIVDHWSTEAPLLLLPA